MTLFTAAFYENAYRPSYDTCFCAPVSGLLPQPSDRNSQFKNCRGT